MNVALLTLAAVVAVLVGVVVFLVGRIYDLSVQLASRNPLEAAQAKRIAASPPRARKNVGDEQELDTLSLGV